MFLQSRIQNLFQVYGKSLNQMTMSEEKSGENLVVHLLSSVSDLMTEILVSVSDCDADGKETIVDEGNIILIYNQ